MELVTEFFAHIAATKGVSYIIGQGFGILAVILGFATYQLKSKRQLLFMQSMVAVAFVIHYGLIAAFPAMAMNAVNIVRNFVYDIRTKRGITSYTFPSFFVAVQCAMCVMNWDAWYSIFLLLGIGINTYCMALSDPQKVRKSIILTSPMVLTYDIFAGSIGGSIYETVAMISAIIGVARHKEDKTSV